MSDDFLITHVCPECSHVWLYPNLFENACPSCGTTIPAVSVDLLAGRREKAAKGEQVDPIILVPDKDTTLHKQFADGVLELRGLIGKTERDATNLADTVTAIEEEAINAMGHQAFDDSDEKQHLRHLYDSAKAVRHLHARLRVIERNMSALFILSDDAEQYPSGLPPKGLGTLRRELRRDGTIPIPVKSQRTDASVFANAPMIAAPTLVDKSPCPECTGHLHAMKQTPVYLICDGCGKTFALGDAQPLKRPERGTFTGKIIETGPPEDFDPRKWHRNLIRDDQIQEGG